jgi:hypothetical protein
MNIIAANQDQIKSNQIKGAAAASFDSFLGNEMIESLKQTNTFLFSNPQLCRTN